MGGNLYSCVNVGEGIPGIAIKDTCAGYKMEPD